MTSFRLLHGDCREVLRSLPEASVQCCVTSPPYWGLRDYGTPEQIGLESTPDAYVAALVAVFRDVRRVLADDGVLWLNLGDSYAGSWGAQSREGAVVQCADQGVDRPEGACEVERGRKIRTAGSIPACSTISARQIAAHPKTTQTGSLSRTPGLKPKDLVGIPWRVAFALQADGWYLRSDVIWAKPNPMPESVSDRPTKSHEYVFLLTKSERYYYDAAAIAEPYAAATVIRGKSIRQVGNDGTATTRGNGEPLDKNTRNARTVWPIATQPYRGAHFAVMPEALAEPCILAGSRPGDTVLDPFNGAGTTGVVAARHGRHYIGIDANAEYLDLARARIKHVAPLFVEDCSGREVIPHGEEGEALQVAP